MIKQFRPFFLVLSVLLISLASCQDKSTALCRSWKIDDLKYTKKIPDLMKPTIQRSIDEMKKSFVLTYTPDGTFTTTLNGKQTLHGTWTLNYSSSKITALTETGQTVNYSIVELNPSSFKFKAMENGQEVTFVMVPLN